MVLAVTGIVVGLAILTAATLLRDRLAPRARRVLAPLAFGAIGIVPGTFLVGRVERRARPAAWRRR